MFKILLIAIVLIVLGTVFAAINFLSPKPPVANTNELMIQTSESDASTSGKLLDQIKKINAQASTAPGSGAEQTSILAYIKLLEETVTVLSRRIDALEKNKSTTTITPSTSPTSTTVTTQYPVYIPLGAGGNTGDQNYVSLNNYLITINANDYSGYSSMQLEVSYKSDQNTGPTYARLYNLTDNSAVASSDASGTSDQNASMTSASFKLPGGSKNYVMQVKNAAGSNTNFYTARLKVSF